MPSVATNRFHIEQLEPRIALHGESIGDLPGSHDAHHLSAYESDYYAQHVQTGAEFPANIAALAHDAMVHAGTPAVQLQPGDLHDAEIYSHIQEVTGADEQLSGVTLYQAGNYLLFTFGADGARNTGILDVNNRYTFGDGSVPLAQVLQDAVASGRFTGPAESAALIMNLASIDEIVSLSFTDENGRPVLHFTAIGTNSAGEGTQYISGSAELGSAPQQQEPGPGENHNPGHEDYPKHDVSQYFNETTVKSTDVQYNALPPELQQIADAIASKYPGATGSDFFVGAVQTLGQEITIVTFLDEGKNVTYIHIGVNGPNGPLQTQPELLTDFLARVLNNDNSYFKSEVLGGNLPQSGLNIELISKVTLTKTAEGGLILTFTGYNGKEQDHCGCVKYTKEFCFAIGLTPLPKEEPPPCWWIPPENPPKTPPKVVQPPYLPEYRKPIYIPPPLPVVVPEVWYGGGGGVCCCCEALAEHAEREGKEQGKAADAAGEELKPENIGADEAGQESTPTSEPEQEPQPAEAADAVFENYPEYQQPDAAAESAPNAEAARNQEQAIDAAGEQAHSHPGKTDAQLQFDFNRTDFTAAEIEQRELGALDMVFAGLFIPAFDVIRERGKKKKQDSV